MSQSERRLAAIMFTDMVGYTALGQKDESLSLAVVEAQQKLLRPVLARHGGREVKTMGDAFLVEFTSAIEAVRCAYDIQRSVREFNFALSSEKRIHLRVGIHLGEVAEKEGDIYGDAVNVASRIQPLAEDGGVCLTQQVYDQVHNKLEFPLTNIGNKALKNVSAPLGVYRMVMPWSEEQVSPSIQLDKNRIAVLPFANISPDPNDEYFADGMTEELITAMSGLQGLQVIARTSVINYKKKEKNVSEIGKELRVGTVLEGSVRKAGNRVRVTAQLIDVPTESHLWSEKYDRELDDIFKIQDDIAGKIADALKTRLAPGREPSRKPPENIEAYTLYLKGRSLWNKMNKEGVLGSLKLFQDAISIDSRYAKAYAGLADAYHYAVDLCGMDGADGLTKAKEAATKALELDETLAEAHVAQGDLAFHDMRYQDALGEFQRAIELNPSSAMAHGGYSVCLDNLGRAKEAMEEVQTAHELDPLSLLITHFVGSIDMNHGRLNEAIAVYDKLIEDGPDFAESYLGRATCFALKGMKDRAHVDVETWHRLTRNEDGYKVKLAFLHGWFGESEKALQMIEEVIPNVGKPGVRELDIADCYAILGNRDAFFTWIDKGLSTRGYLFAASLRSSPFYDKVRYDPRFPEIFKRLGLPY